VTEVPVTAIGAQGDGIASLDGQKIFIPGGLPGDTATVREVGAAGKKGPRFSTVVTEKGTGHQQPPCAHFGACGGCSLQHMTPTVYQDWMAGRLLDPLGQHGLKVQTVLPPVLSPPASRRRLSLRARRLKASVVLGLNSSRTHQIVDLADCPVAAPDLVAIFGPLRAVLADVLPAGKQVGIALTATETGLDIRIDGDVMLDLAAREALAGFADAHDIAALHWRDSDFLDPIAVRRTPHLRFGGVEVTPPPGAFIQATAAGEAALTHAVLEGTKGATAVADLFAGIGTFTFPLAAHAAVTAAEGARTALDALTAASRRAGGLKAVTPVHRDLFRRPMLASELKTFDAVVIDPPRAGAEAQMQELAKSDVASITAISCNPATFARDARILVDGGYRLETIQAVDQFLWSPHLELAAQFRRV